MIENTEMVWKEYHENLLGYIRSRVGDAVAVEDILQDVFVKIYSKIDTLKESSKLKSWIYQVTRNAIIDYYRSHKIMHELPDTLTAPETDTSETARRDIESCLVPMIKSLPDHYRETLMLSEIEGMTQKDVAEKQGLSLSGAKARVQRGRKMIKDLLLQGCSFEYDHQGNLMDYEIKSSGCNQCNNEHE